MFEKYLYYKRYLFGSRIFSLKFYRRVVCRFLKKLDAYHLITMNRYSTDPLCRPLSTLPRHWPLNETSQAPCNYGHSCAYQTIWRGSQFVFLLKSYRILIYFSITQVRSQWYVLLTCFIFLSYCPCLVQLFSYVKWATFSRSRTDGFK